MSCIHFFEKGKGQPLILIHGYCETGNMWLDFAEALSNEFRVLCPDLPGIGNSPISGHQLSLEEVAVSLEEWMESNQIENPILIGHSLGGYVSLALLELMGNRIKAIGLFHSTAFADDTDKKAMRNRTITFLRKYGVEKFVTSFVPPLFPENRREELSGEIEDAIEDAKRCSLNGLIAFSGAMRDRKDRLELLRQYSGPKLLIAGTSDGAVKIEASRAQKDTFTHYFELQGVGHMGMIEQKSETLEIVREFCQAVISPA
ncbi:Pimeloyl-ACP methyl ester carboxylesterase [Algoriphagus alkaliphilus]|uniref:Pimeloyl-ACP methyl ester carboxylesterase n=1 Tax=Algoriphagus alkaliphilus TaxID=279824 RepID=A0A1G5UY24_9BACT|nr:alpha/beta hydrolase [Algoriphagus alkaliphilus]SDA37655.1 Pimeloyl-ACP methyl ester carboxylesterase [Algoriphagus alkaliphilus]